MWFPSEIVTCLQRQRQSPFGYLSVSVFSSYYHSTEYLHYGPPTLPNFEQFKTFYTDTRFLLWNSRIFTATYFTVLVFIFYLCFFFAFKKVFVPGRHDGRGSVTHSWKRMQSGKFRKSFKIFCQAYRNKLGISKVFSVCANLLLSAYVIRIV